MTSGEGSTQAGLARFGSGSEDRPEAEARAVAGDGDGSHAIVDPADERYPDAERRIDVAVTQVDYTLTGSGREERPILHVFGRTGEDGRQPEHVRVHEFRPYFYAPTDSIDEAELTDVDAITGWEETDDDGEPYESIRGERLTKIFGRTPRDVGEIRDRFDHFEADILFPNRLLIDKDVGSGIRVPERRSDDGAIDIPHDEIEAVDATADLRVLTFDIEVDDRRGFPEDGEEPIVCLSSHDSYREEYIAWLYNAPGGEVPPPEDVADHDLLDDEATVEVRAFESEEGMLSAFMDYVEETDVDLMTGWNFEDFDAPYLIDRLDVLGLDSDRLSRVDEVWSGGYGGPNIKGRVVFDLLYAYQRTKFTELDSYRLDDVAEMELGVGKERYPGDIGDLWEEDPQRLLEYNVRDVELCVELDRKQEIVAFWDEARKIVGCKIEDATTPGDAVDMYVLHEAHGEFALPSKGQQETEEFEGGAVFDPITGVKEMVSVLDLKCFSGDTELLTPKGAKNIMDIEPGDPIYTLDPDTFECEVTSVAETHEYDNQYGELHHLSGNTHDFKITENHRLLTSNERGWDEQTPEDFAFAEYRDLTETERYAFPQHEPMPGETPESFDLIPTGVYREHSDVIDSHADGLFLKYGAGHRETPVSFEMADWLEFLGWFVTEGSIDRSANRITIHQQEETHREAIRELLARMGINHSVSDPGIYVSNQFLFDWLEENCGAGYANKQLPEWVFDLDGELLKLLLDTMIRGDGSRADSGLGKFWTKSDQLKDDIVDLAVRCGEKPTVSKQGDGTWYVSIGKRGSFQKKTNATVESHDGTVYCVTAEENHVVLAGRNGHFQWIGQSLYPMSMVTINASPETQVNPESYDGETYHTPTGIHFRKEPDGIIREMVNELLDEREEKKALRNDHDPGSSEYERYDRQQAAVKVIMNCFTPDTDVLTPDGVRNIRDLEVGDPVYSLDPDSMEMEVKPVAETHAYPDYRGELVDIETSKIDFRVTPNHRMLVRKNDRNGITEDGWSFVEAGELYDYCHYEMAHDWDYDHADALGERINLVNLVSEYTDLSVTVSDGGAKMAAQGGSPNVMRSISTDDFLEFLAWFITEGSVYHAETGNYRVQIAQQDGEIRKEIESFVRTFVDYYYVNEQRISFSSRVWAEILESLCGDSSENKRIPEVVFQASEEQKRRFLDTLIEGDGDWQENAWRFTTISDELRDDVLRLCTHLGLTASHNHDGEAWRIYVTENGKNTFRMHRSGSRSTAENGVYCVTVEDNHTLLAGRNGKYQFSHNSLYGVFGWDRFRLYDREMSAGVTSTNREVIEFTERAANELNKEVIYGDSVTGDRPVVVRDSGGRVRIEPIEELFERAESEVVIAADGARAGSADLPKERRALPGWDALSMNDDGDAEWQPIEEVVRHETDEPVVRLQHKFGESTTTRDHSYVVEEDGEFVESPPGDVDEPFRIPGISGVETVETIDVYELLEGYMREYEDGRSVGAENAVTKSKRVHADENWVWFGHEHHGEIDSTAKLTREIDLTAEDGSSFIRLLAAYITEGSASTVETTESRFGASIAESRREWLEGLQKDYYRLFENTTAGIVASDSGGDRTVSYGEDGEREVTYDDGTLKLQMMNELAAVFFREFAGQTSRGKRIPSFVFHLPGDQQDLFLDVLVEGDGSREFPRYSEAYAERNFDFKTTSRELAAGLSTLLTQRGKKHSLKYRDAKDSYTIRTVDYYRGGRDPVLEERDHDGYVYDLSVAENENFVDAVGGLVLHNTDSVMLELGGDTPKDEAIERSFEIEEHINDRYDEFAREELNAATHRFQIEFEKLYRRFFQAGKKKRYAGHIVWKEGKDVDDIDITGFEYQRSDIAPVTKEVQREVLEMIVTGESTETVTEYVHDVIERFQEGDVDLEEIGVPGGIGKRLDNYETDTAQVRGAKYANLLLGTNFGRGSKPKRLYLEKVHPDFWKRFEAENPDVTDDPLYLDFKRDPDVICFQYADQVPEEFRVDYDEMLEKTLKGPIARVIEALGMSWDEVASGQEQTGLGSFM